MSGGARLPPLRTPPATALNQGPRSCLVASSCLGVELGRRLVGMGVGELVLSLQVDHSLISIMIMIVSSLSN